MQKIIKFSTLVIVFAAFLIIQEAMNNEYAFAVINLTGSDINWDTRNYAKLNQTGNDLRIDVDVVNNETIYNRMFMISNFSGSDTNPVLRLTYATNATVGNPQFVFETRTNLTEDDQTNKSPFLQYDNLSKIPQKINSIDLGNTLGYLTIRNYELPIDIVNSTSEFRFYIISTGTTMADLTVKNGTIS